MAVVKEKLVKDQDKVIVRLPDGMREKLKARAAEGNRSMNQEIVARLERTFAHDARAHLNDVFEKVRSGGYPDGVPVGPAKSAPDEREEDVARWSREVSLPGELATQLEDLRSTIHRQTDIIFMQTDLMRSIVGDPRPGADVSDPVAAFERLAAEVRSLRSSIDATTAAPAEPADGDKAARATKATRGVKPPKEQ